jgi:hypothetical protein
VERADVSNIVNLIPRTHPVLYSGINSIGPIVNQKFKLDSKYLKKVS